MSNEWNGKFFSPMDPNDVLSKHEVVILCSEST